MTDGLPPSDGGWRRLCREPGGNGTRKGAMAFVRSSRLDTAGNRRFSGAQQVPGADVWLASETSRGLDPDGWMVRRPYGRHHTQENRDASAATKRGVCQAARHGKKVVKSGVGGSIASCQEPSNGCISYTRLIVALAEVTYVDSAGLAALIEGL